MANPRQKSADESFQSGTVYTVAAEFLFVPFAFRSYNGVAVSPGHKFLFRELPKYLSSKRSSCATFYMVGASRDHYFLIEPKHFDKLVAVAAEEND